MPLTGGAPKQVLPPDRYNSADISRDTRLAGYLNIEVNGYKYTIKVADLATGKPVSEVLLDRSDLGIGHFSPNDQALIYTVLRNGGHTLLYQPLDGSPSRQFVDPMSETISDFTWSPSGKQLALSLVKSSPDVVLITDQAGKGKN